MINSNKSPARNITATITPKKPETQATVSSVEKSEQSPPVATTAPPTWSWVYSPSAFGGMAGTPTTPYGGAIPMTPQSASSAMNPYAYYGGYWPTMPYVQDPMATMAYYPYASPTVGGQTADEGATTPARLDHDLDDE